MQRRVRIGIVKAGIAVGTGKTNSIKLLVHGFLERTIHVDVGAVSSSTGQVDGNRNHGRTGNCRRQLQGASAVQWKFGQSNGIDHIAFGGGVRIDQRHGGRDFDRLGYLSNFHLHVDSDVLAERIKADELDVTARQWRLDHIGDYEKSRPWMESAADLVIDTTNLPVADVAGRIAAEAEIRIAEAGQARS